MKLRSVEIENFRAIEHLKLSLDESLTVFHGDNAHGKTSILSTVAVGLGWISTLLPEVTGVSFRDSDRRHSAKYVRVILETTDGLRWSRRKGRLRTRRAKITPPVRFRSLRGEIAEIVDADDDPRTLPALLQRLFTTSRSYFAPFGERILEQNTGQWV